MKKQLLGMLALVLLAPFANAVNVGFTGLGGVPSGGYSTTIDGVTISVTAPGESLGYLNLDGIGVKKNCCDLAGMQNNEKLLVSFSHSVTLGSVTFRQWEGPDKVQLTSAGGNLTLDAETCLGCSAETFDLSSLGAITSFQLEGDSIGTVTFLAGLGDVTAVPVPAAAWLFGSAVLGLGGIARRKRKQ